MKSRTLMAWQPSKDVWGILFVLTAAITLILSQCDQGPPLAPAHHERVSEVSVESDADSLVAHLLVGSPASFQGPDKTLRRMARVVRATSEWYGVDPLRIARLIYVESYADSMALGRSIEVRAHGRTLSTRAVGLGQIVPEIWLGTFPECGGDLVRIRDNVCYTVLVYRWYRDRYPDDPGLALLAYNGCRRGWSCDWYEDAILDY